MTTKNLRLNGNYPSDPSNHPSIPSNHQPAPNNHPPASNNPFQNPSNQPPTFGDEACISSCSGVKLIMPSETTPGVEESPGVSFDGFFTSACKDLQSFETPLFPINSFGREGLEKNEEKEEEIREKREEERVTKWSLGAPLSSPLRAPDSVRSRLMGDNNKMLSLSPLYTSKSKHLRNNIKGRCLSNQNLQAIPAYTSHNYQLDALSLSPTHLTAPKFKSFKNQSDQKFFWNGGANGCDSELLKNELEKVKEKNILSDKLFSPSNENFSLLLEASCKTQSSKTRKKIQKKNFKHGSSSNNDSSGSDESERGLTKGPAGIISKTTINLTKSFFNKTAQHMPSNNFLDQFKVSTNNNNYNYNNNNTKPVHRSSRTETNFPPHLTSPQTHKHPRSASTSATPGKAKRHSVRYDTIKRESMPNMNPPSCPPSCAPYQQRHSVGRNSSWGSFSCKPRLREFFRWGWALTLCLV